MVNWLWQLKEAYINVRIATLRSFLSILGIVIGTGAVVVMIGCILAAREQVLAQFKALGTDLLSVTLYQHENDEANGDVWLGATMQNILRDIPGIQQTAVYMPLYVPIFYNGKNKEGVVIGAENALENILKFTVTEGRLFRFFDRDSHYCLIGANIAKQLKEDELLTKGLVGKQIQLGEHYFTILGVITRVADNMFLNQDINNAIFVPFQTISLLSREINTPRLMIQVQEKANIKVVEGAVKVYLQSLILKPSLYFQSAKSLQDSMLHQKNIITSMLGIVCAISLVMGGVGVMNMMLLSISARKSEIGIRKTIGATQKDIQRLFFLESLILSLSGGFLGVMLGIIVAWVLAGMMHWPFKFSWLSSFIGFLASALTGIFFGVYPASRAARLEPIKTLRME